MPTSPRSIRGKLVLVLIIAITPVIALHIHHEISYFNKHLAAGMDSYYELEADIVRCIVGVVLGIAIAFISGNKFRHILRRLTYAASAISVGDFRKRVEIHTGDEFEELGNAFNELAQSLAINEIAIKNQAEMVAGMTEAARVASSSLDIEKCGKSIAKVVCTHLGAKDATVFYKNTEEGNLKTIGRCGKRSRSVWRLIASHAIESGGYLVISEKVAHSKSETVQGAILVGIPITAGSGPIGAIVARFEGALAKSDLAMGSVRADILTAFGIHAAAALNNADAHSKIEQYSETLEDWVEDLSLVMRVTNAISPSLTLDETLTALAEETAHALRVEGCAIYLPDRRGELVSRGCSAPELDISIILNARLRPNDSDSGVAFAEKRTVLCSNTLKSKWEATREKSKASGVRSLLSTPLIVEERAIGVITVYAKRPHKFTQREIRLLTSIGLHTAVIVRNAGLYTRESSIAETLQNNLISAVPEEYRGLRFAGRYDPALDEARIGGDFYEITPLPNGKVGVVIADVSGKGLKAAMHLAACKYMMKPLIFANPDDPAAVLSELNSAVNYYFDLSFFVTIFYGVIDPEKGVIEYANAGHMPGLLIADGCKIHTCLSSTGIPVGSGYGCQYGSHRVSVNKTDVLLLYTDGVTDMILEDGPLEVEGLHRLIFEAGSGSVDHLVDYIRRRLNDNPNSRQVDDIALLAISFDGVQATGNAIVGGNSGQEYSLPTQSP